MTTAIKERPIPFKAEMVRAILDGRKTQTRRVMKSQPEVGGPFPICNVCGMPKPPKGRSVGIYAANSYCCSHDCKGYWEEPITGDLWPRESRGDFGYPDDWMGKCSYGKPGDRLWVREGFCALSYCPGEYGGQGEAGYPLTSDIKKEPPSGSYTLVYRADEPGEDGPWRPSTNMPRWASRITLEVTDVRVERVQDISEGDAMAEGIQKEDVCPSGFDPDSFHPPGAYGFVSGLHPFPKGMIYVTPQEAFRELWESINAKRGFGWDANPWVWVISFKRLEG